MYSMIFYLSSCRQLFIPRVQIYSLRLFHITNPGFSKPQSAKLVSDREKLRNVGIVAHINAGKTTTTERILYHAGSTDTMGNVDEGSTVTDYLVQERDRGITITSAAVSFDWKKHRVNLIDTPGHVDFTIEVERSLSVLDGTVTILDASAGVEAQTITVWNQAKKYRLPNVIFLNKYDKPFADYKMCMKDLELNLDINAKLVQLPIKSDKGNLSILDIIKRNQVTWFNPEEDHGTVFRIAPINGSGLDKKYSELLEEEREKLINSLTDLDEELSNHVLECDKISEVSSEQIEEALRRATLNSAISPVLIGSSFKYIGVQQLMDAIVRYLPSPIDRERLISETINLPISDCNTDCYFIFKIMHDKRLGPLTYLKICNGSLTKLKRVKNLETSKVEQVKRVYRAFADELKEIDESATKNDIVVVTGLTESKTGDIIVDQYFELESTQNEDTDLHQMSETIPFQLLNKQIIVPRINQMEPVYFCSIESLNSSQQIKLEHALACLAREDPSFKFEIDEIGITTIRGMGKLHLEVVRDRIKSEYNIEPLLGPLQISYRETIDGSANEELTVNRLINSVNNSLTIKIYVRSKPKAGAWSERNLRIDTSGDSTLGKLRSDYKKAIGKGIASALAHGPSLGYPIIDCDILLLDFKANNRCGYPVISAAASQCLTNAIKRCSPVLLEPIMLLEVVVPKEYNGSVLSDISSRRGVVLSTLAKSAHTIVIRSLTPLSSLADYSEFLRIMTSGRGSFSMELQAYSAMSEADKQSVVRS